MEKKEKEQIILPGLAVKSQGWNHRIKISFMDALSRTIMYLR